MAKQSKEIEIPFGAKDSELCGWEYTIPEGMEATIVDNKIVVKKKESENESIRNDMIDYFNSLLVQSAKEEFNDLINNKFKRYIAWLKKQDEKINAIDNFDTEFEKQVSHLIASAISKEHEYNHSYVKWTADALLNYAKHELEKQGEWKPFDYENANIQQKDFALKFEPNFKVGDWITNGHCTCQITFIDSRYWYSETCVLGNITSIDKTFHLWTIQGAKDGDVLCSGRIILLFKKWEDTDWNFVIAYAGIDISGELQITNGHWLISNYAHPATKEQCDTLFAKIKEAGYEWDADKKELKKIENKNKKND